nr:hypothetical protein HUO10_005027 [Paraburkholderia busanensis]
MTVEIKELVIQARIVDDDSAIKDASRTTVADRMQEARLVELVTKRVLERLRDQGWGER